MYYLYVHYIQVVVHTFHKIECSFSVISILEYLYLVNEVNYLTLTETKNNCISILSFFVDRNSKETSNTTFGTDRSIHV